MARIGIVCGGTGGHLYPGLAVAECLRDAGHRVRLYVSNKEIDQRVLKTYPDFEHVVLPAMGWPGFGTRIPAFIRSFVQAYQISVKELREFVPDAVLGMGGFTCAPLLWSAGHRKIPTLLHESNAIPGKVTRWLAPRATRVLLGFSECAAHLEASSIHVTGTPVRASLRRVDKVEAAAYWNLDARKFTLAVMGGSQGASGLNRLVARAAVDWKEIADQLQIIHLSGPQDVELLTYNYQRVGLRAEVRSFCDRMEMVYSLADGVVARSGASSLTELAYFELPSVLVPYPHAAEDHQTKNANIYAKNGAAVVVAETEAGTQRTAAWVLDMVRDVAQRTTMAEAAGRMNPGDAASLVAREVEHVLF